MTAADLEALADRVEREVPSRELDRAIARAVGFRPSWAGSHGEAHFYAPGAPEGSATPIAREYTTSLDAAATLVPEGLHLDLHDWTWAEEPCWSAGLQSSKGPTICLFARAATRAAALTAACLRARAALLKEPTDG